MIKAKIANSKGVCNILEFCAVGANNVPVAIVVYPDGELDSLPLHELRIELPKAPKNKQGYPINA